MSDADQLPWYKAALLGAGWENGVNLAGFSVAGNHPHLQQVFRASRCFPTAFNLDYYTEVLDLSYLVDHLASDPFFRNYRRLNAKLVEVIEDYSLVSFVPLNVQVMQWEERGRESQDVWEQLGGTWTCRKWGKYIFCKCCPQIPYCLCCFSLRPQKLL